MDFRRFARRAAKVLPILLALGFLFLSFSHHDNDSFIKESRADAGERTRGYQARTAMDRERYLASRQGLRFGMPMQAVARAKAQRRAMAANLADAKEATVALPSIASQWNPIGPVPMMQEANFTGSAIGSPAAMTGRVTSVAADSHGVIVAGTASGGLWVSTDDGVNFASTFDNEPTESIGAIVLDTTTTPSTIYVGTGEGNNSVDSLYGAGLFKSSNLGQSWTHIGGSTFVRASFSSLAIDTHTTPGTPRLFAAITSGFSANRADAGIFETDASQAGLWKSTDGGNNWSQYPESTFNNCDVFGGTSAPCPADDVKIDPLNAQNVYVAINTDTIYYSNDGGQTFHPANLPSLIGTPQGRHSLAIGPAFPPNASGAVYAMVGSGPQNPQAGSNFLAMFVSFDAGNSWNSMMNPAPPTVPSYTANGMTIDGTTPLDETHFSQSFYDQAILVKPGDVSTVYFGGVGLYLSAGTYAHSWSFIGQNGGIHADIHALTFDPNDNEILVGTDGGLFKFDPTQGATPTFVSLNQKISAAMIQGIGPHPTDPTKLIAGFQSSGTQLFNGSISGWTSPPSETGDGGFAFYDPHDPTFLYHDYSGDQLNLALIATSTDGGTTWCHQPDATVPACNVGDQEWTPNLENEFAKSLTQLFPMGDPGPSFYPALAVDPMTAHRVLLGAHGVYVSTDGMAHWSQQSESDLDLTSPGGFKGVNCTGPGTGSCPCNDNSCSIEDLEFGPPVINNANPNNSIFPLWALAMSSLDGSVAFEVTNTTQGNLQTGAFWSDVTTPLDTVLRKSNSTFGVLATQATSIATDPFNSNVAYLALSGFTVDPLDPNGGTAVGHLYKTVNFGTTWTQADGNSVSNGAILQNPATGLPDIPVLKVLVDKTNESGTCGGNPCSNSVFVGTDIGVFHSTDGGNTWAPFNSGLPDVPVYDLAQNSNGTIFAGTHGRGAFELTTPSTATATATATATSRASGTPTATATSNGTPTATATSKGTPTATTTSRASGTPTATGTSNGTPTGTATATGTIMPTPTVTATPDGAKMVAPKALVLPAAGIGIGTPATRSFVIRNSSRMGNLIGSVAIDPTSVMPQLSTFTVTAGTPFNIAPLKTDTVTVSLTPNGTANTANAIITSNDPAHLSQTVSIKGAAFAGRASAPAAVTISGTVGQVAQTMLKITNVGRGTLSGSWPSVTTAPYSVTGQNFGPLQPHGTATVTIDFTATAKGRAMPGSLTITVNAPSTGGRTVSLRGVGK